MDKAVENLNGVVALPSDPFVPKLVRESARASSVPVRRSERIKKRLERLKCNNSLAPDMKMNMTSPQCAGTHSETDLKCPTGAIMPLDGKNITALGINNVNGKGKRKLKSNTQAKCIKSSTVTTGEPSRTKEKSEVVKGPVWRGCFQSEKFGLLSGLTAHASKRASEEVFNLAGHLPELLNLQAVHCLDVWPEYYSSYPNDGIVDLTIFPEDERNETAFNELVTHLLDHDLALKTVVDDVAFLVFASPLLQYEYWRAGGKYYLWAVFSGKNALFPQSQKLHLCASNEEPPTDSNLSGNAAIADDRNSSRNLDNQEEQKGKKRMKSREMLVPVLKNCDCTMLEEQDEGLRPCTTDGVGSQSVDASVFQMFDTFDDLNSEGITSADKSGKPEQRYPVRPSLVSTLGAIIKKHGDIARDCPLPSGELLTHALERVCEAVKDLEALQFNELQRSFLDSLYSTISYAELLKLNVKWLRDRCDELMEAVSGVLQCKKLKVDLKQYTAVIQSKQKDIELKRTKLMKLQSRIQTLESEVASMTADVDEANKTISRVKSKCMNFRRKSLVNGLI